MSELKPKLNPQAIRILDILDDGEWHCPIEWGYEDGHCKRITDINEYLKFEGKEVIGNWCDCGRHKSKIKKRRIIPLNTEKPRQEPNFASGRPVREFCCVGNWRGGNHDPKCFKIKL